MFQWRTAFAAALLLSAICASAGNVSAGESETIGVVKSCSGDAAVMRGAETLPASPGTKLRAGDLLSTGSDGTLGVVLRDDSSLSLGPHSRIHLERFRFSPRERKFDLLVRIARGSMAFLSGLIGKLSPENARFETPTATIGIRGTRFVVHAAPLPSR